VRSARLEYQITGCALPLNDEANKRWSALGEPCAASTGRAWAAGLLMQLETNVCCWHETDMPILLRNVRSQGQSGKHVLALSFSGLDPTRTSTLLGARFRLEGYDNSRVRLLPRQRGQCK